MKQKLRSRRYVVLVHGGYVGSAHDNWITPDVLTLTQHIVEAAREKLAHGGGALDVVVEAIKSFEDSGLTDAGRGSYHNSAGFVEMDASLMVGDTGAAGAVAGLTKIKNPVVASRIVMESTPHVLLAGSTGEQSLIHLGAEVVSDPATYFVPVRPPQNQENRMGTVGAVAMDSRGLLVAGTSTGGTYGKMPGRVGDAPIVGASTFATERFGLSATGAGEHFIRRGATRDIVARVTYLGESLEQATTHMLRLIADEDRSRGAIIAISRDGDLVVRSTGYGILHGFADDQVQAQVAIRAGAPHTLGLGGTSE
jgi:isoaspartyl peptidase/L-asparaginase-like protein (Ntn-hydrolase superfamily)